MMRMVDSVVNIMQSILVGLFLPRQIINDGFLNAKQEEALMSILPMLVYIHQRSNPIEGSMDSSRGMIEKRFDLLPYLKQAKDYSKIIQKMSYGQALDYYDDQCEKQGVLFSRPEFCQLPLMGIALALFLKKMMQIKDPSEGAGLIKRYIEQAEEASDSQFQMGLFGEPTEEELKALENESALLFINTVLPKNLASKLTD